MYKTGNFSPGTRLPFRFWLGRDRWEDRPYVVERLLSGGGQADTYIAAPEGGGPRVCLKHLYGPFASDKATYYRKVVIMTKYPAPSPHLAWPLGASPAPSSSGKELFE